MAEYKDITELKKQIADFKKAVHSPNGDYLTGYVCALSATEGIIAGLPDADVVEVVRCKDCEHWKKGEFKGGDTKENLEWGGSCALSRFARYESDFCSYGERRTVSEDGK